MGLWTRPVWCWQWGLEASGLFSVLGSEVIPNVKGISMTSVFLDPAQVWVGGLDYGLSHPNRSTAESSFLTWAQDSPLKVQNCHSSLPERHLIGHEVGVWVGCLM